jgi:hypothetical protein
LEAARRTKGSDLVFNYERRVEEISLTRPFSGLKGVKWKSGPTSDPPGPKSKWSVTGAKMKLSHDGTFRTNTSDVGT